MDIVGAGLLARLLDDHGAALVLFARQWCDTPEDVVQEAFLQLLRQKRAPKCVVAWLYRVVRNGALSASRSQARRLQHEAAASWRGEPFFLPAEDDALDAVTASRALEDLPLEQRETIVARLWGRRSFDEIAELTGTSLSTAHRRYHAGLVALRARLEQSCLQKNEK